MKILIAISSLGPGGAEKAAADLAAALDARGHEVVLATWSGTDRDARSCPVRRVVMGHDAPSRSAWGAARSNLARIRSLRSVLTAERPDVVLAFMDRTGVTAVLAARPSRTPVVISERSDPRSEPLGRTWRLLRSYGFRHAAAVVPNSRSVADWLRAKLPNQNVEAIPNFVEVKEATPGVRLPAGPFVLAVGRLIPTKGHAGLIRAFAGCPDRTWHLVVLGEGPERTRLEGLVRDRSLAGRVHLPGFGDPWSYLSRASVFALPSRFEGFPNALLEAMAMGKPCVSYGCGAGPDELIEDGVNGLLVPLEDEVALRERLRDLMTDPGRRDALGNNARRVCEEYAPDRIVERWESLLTEAARRGAAPCM